MRHHLLQKGPLAQMRDGKEGKRRRRQGANCLVMMWGWLEPPKTSILRKEVIQPQVPLRLPCYDFGPVADPTVAGCLPCGLAHRAKVEPTPMPWRAVCTRPGNVFTAACCSAITSDSTFMYSSCRVQSELGRFFGISLLSRVSCPLSPPL